MTKRQFKKMKFSNNMIAKTRKSEDFYFCKAVNFSENLIALEPIFAKEISWHRCENIEFIQHILFIDHNENKYFIYCEPEYKLKWYDIAYYTYYFSIIIAGEILILG